MSFTDVELWPLKMCKTSKLIWFPDDNIISIWHKSLFWYMLTVNHQINIKFDIIYCSGIMPLENMQNIWIVTTIKYKWNTIMRMMLLMLRVIPVEYVKNLKKLVCRWIYLTKIIFFSVLIYDNYGSNWFWWWNRLEW